LLGVRQVNGPDLVARIGALSPAQELAIIDAMERLRVRIFVKGWTNPDAISLARPGRGHG